MLRRRTACGTGLVAALALSTACEPAPIVAPNPEEELLGTPESDVDPEDLLPEPVAFDVLRYLDQENFREEWSLWPGKGRQFEGGDPHGVLLTNYLNPLALEAVEGRSGSMPHGAIIVKDNFARDVTDDFRADAELLATTLMYKRGGSTTDANDWFWMKWLPDGTVEDSGAVEGCRNCHAEAADNDFIMTESIR